VTARQPADDGIERDVCATPDEFARGLEGAFPGAVTATAYGLRVDTGAAAIEVTVVAQPPRLLGALALPRIRVAIRWVAGTDRERAALLATMDRAMQRGGG
jgi:hypothetical protein